MKDSTKVNGKLEFPFGLENKLEGGIKCGTYTLLSACRDFSLPTFTSYSMAQKTLGAGKIRFQ